MTAIFMTLTISVTSDMLGMSVVLYHIIRDPYLAAFYMNLLHKQMGQLTHVILIHYMHDIMF